MGVLKVPYNPGLQTEAPVPLLVDTIFRLGVAMLVYVTPGNYECPGGIPGRR